MLTAAQERAKMKAENNGQIFMPPSQYKAMMQNRAKPKYSKKAVKVNPQQVATYSARKAYKSDFKEISPDTDALIDQCLNPEDVNEITRWPNTYGLSATYKCKNIINAKFSADNRCCVAVNPTVKDAIYTTNGTETDVLLNTYFASTTVSNPFSYQSFVLQGESDIQNWSAPIQIGNDECIIPFPHAQSGLLCYPLQIAYSPSTPVGAQNNIYFSIRFAGAVSHQAKVRVVFLDEDFNNMNSAGFAPIASVSNPSGMGLDNGQNSWGGSVEAPSVRYFALQIQGQSLPFKGDAFFFFHHDKGSTAQDGYLIAPNHAQHVNVFDIKDADVISDSAQQAFVLAQSLLITAQMSDLNNGGVLSIARVPGRTVVGEGDSGIDSDSWYEWIASLPYHAYDGAVKNGGYSWYLPEDETGFFYRPLDTYFGKDLPFIVSEFTVSDNTEASVVRIKVCTIVQFTTNSSIYECRPSCHVSEMEFMHHVLSLVQASYSNDGHKGGLKNALLKIKPLVIKLLKNPKTYATVASILAGLAGAIL